MSERKKILVVDDIVLNRTMMRSVLSADYDIEEAEHGRAALDMLIMHPKRFQLIITDIMMPILDGFELLSELKNTVALKDIPVLVVTAADEHEYEVKALELGAVDVITRPCEDKVITRRVSNIFLMNVVPGFKNVMEEIVKKEILNCRASLGICTCESCMRDLLTLTLNRLKPKYVNTEKGELLSKVNQLSYSSQIEIVSTIASAAETIKKNPRHHG